MGIATDASPSHGAFYFQRTRFPLTYSGTWPGSVYNIHIVLQELYAVALMLCKMAFQLPCKVVALPLDTSTTKAYLCNKSGRASFPFFPD